MREHIIRQRARLLQRSQRGAGGKMFSGRSFLGIHARRFDLRLRLWHYDFAAIRLEGVKGREAVGAVWAGTFHFSY
jgi:hypothetical protein